MLFLVGASSQSQRDARSEQRAASGERRAASDKHGAEHAGGASASRVGAGKCVYNPMGSQRSYQQ